jgi:hypothetical protein
VYNFWLKHLTETHKYLAESFNKLIENDNFPTCLMTAVTYFFQEVTVLSSPKIIDESHATLQRVRYINNRKGTHRYVEDNGVMPK